MEAWYALHTKPRAEYRVAHTLRLRGLATYLPLVSVQGRRRVQPFFPSYLFVRCDLAEVGLSSLEWVPGLLRVLTFDGRPATVPDQAIEVIRAGLSKIEAEGGLPPHSFKPGDQVLIRGGPLDGLCGIFQGPPGPVQRVQVLIHFLGQANRTEIPVGMLRPLSEKPAPHWHRRGTRGRGRHIHYETSVHL